MLLRRAPAVFIVSISLFVLISCSDNKGVSNIGPNRESAVNTSSGEEIAASGSAADITDPLTVGEGRNQKHSFKIKYFEPKSQGGHLEIFGHDVAGNYITYTKDTLNENERLYIFDMETEKEKVLYEPETAKIINDTRIGNKYIFWTEGEPNMAEEKWQIKEYDRSTGRVATIKSNEEISILIPRIDNEGDMLIWMEGYSGKDKDKADYTIYCYNANIGKISVLSEVGFVDNIYDTIKIRNGYISFVDNIEGKWVIKVLNVNDRSVYDYNCGLMPARPVCDGMNLVWCENINDVSEETLYYYNIKTGEKSIIAKQFGGLFDMVDGNVVYRDSPNLKKYYKNTKETVCLTEGEVEKGKAFPVFFACDSDTIVTDEISDEQQSLIIIRDTK